MSTSSATPAIAHPDLPSDKQTTPPTPQTALPSPSPLSAVVHMPQRRPRLVDVPRQRPTQGARGIGKHGAVHVVWHRLGVPPMVPMIFRQVARRRQPSHVAYSAGPGWTVSMGTSRGALLAIDRARRHVAACRAKLFQVGGCVGKRRRPMQWRGPPDGGSGSGRSRPRGWVEE